MTSAEMPANAPMATRERGRTPPPSPWLRLLHDELTAISPARWSRMLRMTALVPLVTIISMALRVPEAALSAYMIFFISKPDVAATVRTGLGGMLAVTVGIALTFVFYSLTFSEPALRMLVMVCMTFAGMYAMRSSPVGVLGFLIGFVTSYALTLVDRGYGPEVLTRGILWLWVVLAYPIALLVVTDVILGQRPADLFRQGVAARLEGAAEYLRSPAGSDAASRTRVERLERAGTGDISSYVKDRSSSITAARQRVVQQLDFLFLLLRELPAESKHAPAVQRALARAADVCLYARGAVLAEEGVPAAPPATALEEPGMRSSSSSAALAVVLPLLGCVQDLARAVLDAREPGAPSAQGAAHEEARPPAPAASPSKTTESVRFALKVTLAAMSSYIIFTSLAWTGIHTAILTCYFVAQDSVGGTIHKATLRIVGALIGGGLGIGAIVYVLPHLETAGGLAVIVAAVSLFAAWIATGSEAISYAGLQLAFAFYLAVLQGFSRTSRMVVARDRVIGILLGNLIMSVVFTYVWPERIGSTVRRALSRSAEALAATIRCATGQAAGRELHEAEAAFHTGLWTAIQSAPTGRMELGDDDPWSLIPAMKALFVRIHAIARQPIDVQALPPAAREALSELRESVARWLSDLARAIAAPAPAPVFQPAAAAVAELEGILGTSQEAGEPLVPLRLRVEWFGQLNAQIERFTAEHSRPLGKGTPP